MKKITKISSDKPKQNAKKLRVAAYCRVSTDNDAQLESLEAQKKHYENYISIRVSPARRNKSGRNYCG